MLTGNCNYNELKNNVIKCKNCIKKIYCCIAIHTKSEKKNLYPYPPIYLMLVVLSAMLGEDSKPAVLFVS